MYTILVNDDNTLTTSVRQKIIQGSSNVDYMHILVNPFYENIDMSLLNATLYYTLPISKKEDSIQLVPSEMLYKDKKLEYIVCFDETLTSEEGDIEVYLAFTNDGNIIRKTNCTFITVCSIGSNQKPNVPDIPSTTSTPDNICLDKETNEIYLTSNGVPIGGKISINELSDTIVESSNDGLVTMITE